MIVADCSMESVPEHPPEYRAGQETRDLLEYVVVHEMLHVIEPTHGERFIALLQQHYPTLREARAELNELPLAPYR